MRSRFTFLPFYPFTFIFVFYLFTFLPFYRYNTVAANLLALSLKAVVSASVSP